MRQLQDPLMLSTGSLPPWCAELIVGCHFLFPIECRDFYTGCTAFGISRALHSMQQRVQGSSPSDRPTEVRIGRIQRQKIRVSRGRLLTSAMRALELYAGHRSMIEVEYYGEAGTGLGPTLEFYTLVSQELQVCIMIVKPLFPVHFGVCAFPFPLSLSDFALLVFSGLTPWVVARLGLASGSRGWEGGCHCGSEPNGRADEGPSSQWLH